MPRIDSYPPMNNPQDGDSVPAWDEGGEIVRSLSLGKLLDGGSASSPGAPRRLRADTAANWTAANPVLLLGEEGLETDTGRRKVGDGTTAWNSLAYVEDFVAVHPGVASTSLNFRWYSHKGTRLSSSMGGTFANCAWSRVLMLPSGEVTDLAIELTEGAGTGAVGRIGLYEMDARGVPGALIGQTGALDFSDAGEKPGAVTPARIIAGPKLCVVSVTDRPAPLVGAFRASAGETTTQLPQSTVTQAIAVDRDSWLSVNSSLTASPLPDPHPITVQYSPGTNPIFAVRVAP